MQVFKFGGASVKDADGVKNLVNVLKTVGYKDTLVVVSAMGKTTNALEKVIHYYFHEKLELQSGIQDILKFHNSILLDLFEEHDPIFRKVTDLFKELSYFFERNKSPNYNFVYDQVVGYGELVSTTIINGYLQKNGIDSTWLDVRDLIKTDNFYRYAKVDWEATQENILKSVSKNKLAVTQGFLGSDANNFTTTLGREGSDYTAAIFAYCLNANAVTIWKDVPGVLNADPRHFENAQLLHQISYTEAIELAFYGASVIHPKTLQPLQRKEIPLYVKSFIKPKENGTRVGKGITLQPELPCYIVKKDQILISLSSLDFSYIVEDNISNIFKLLHQYKMKVDVIQNSAISFSVCVDDNYKNIEDLLIHLKASFAVTCHKNVALYTIRHYTSEAVQMLEQDKTVLLKQLTKKTMQMVTAQH